MNHLVPISAVLTWLVLLTFSTTQGEVPTSDDNSALPKDLDDSMEIEAKRDWNRNLHSWGKRGWQRLQGGWGKRDAASHDRLLVRYPTYADKRAWNKLQGGWGKRLSPDDEYAVRQLAAILDDQDERDYPSGDFDDSPNSEPSLEEKRAWKGLNGGWGKRDSWSNFRGSWGKREPAWTNLKGMWGKR